MKDSAHIPAPLLDATTAAKASAGSVVVTWFAALFSIETIVYLSFFFGVVAAVFSIVRHFRDEKRAQEKERREIELHHARLAALARGESVAAADTGCGSLA